MNRECYRYYALSFPRWTLVSALRHLSKAPDNILCVNWFWSHIISLFQSFISFFWNSNWSSLKLLFSSHFLGTRAGILHFSSRGHTGNLGMESPPGNGNVNLTAVPSGSTWWRPCLHKPDFRSLSPRSVLALVSSSCNKAASKLPGRSNSWGVGLGSTVRGWDTGTVPSVTPAESGGKTSFKCFSHLHNRVRGLSLIFLLNISPAHFPFWRWKRKMHNESLNHATVQIEFAVSVKHTQDFKVLIQKNKTKWSYKIMFL